MINVTPAKLNGASAVFNLVFGLAGLIGIGGIDVMNLYKGLCIGFALMSVVLLTANLAFAILISKGAE